MKMLARALVVASLATVAGSPLAAQSVNGSWITEFERRMRNENGSVSADEKAKARLVLQQRGDSVTGTWQVLGAPAGSPATLRQLRGTISGAKVSLSTEVEARRNINGEESVAKLTLAYDFVVNGDKLEGTMTTRAADMEMPARPFSAVREKP